MFKGSITALITPFKDGEIDWPAFENFIEWQIDQGAHGLVPCGTTGESPTLTHDEHMAIVKRCVDVVKGRIPVIAGTGSNSTREAIKLTKHAKEVNADAALIVGPYYNKPMQEGIYEHYKAIHDEVSMPIILYTMLLWLIPTLRIIFDHLHKHLLLLSSREGKKRAGGTTL